MLVKIKIEPDSELIPKIKSKVNFNEEWYRIKSSKYEKINYVHLLNIEHDQIFKYSDKYIGDNLIKGDVIAHKKNFLKTKKIISAYDGVLEEIDHSEGIIIIRTEGDDTVKNKSFFEGVIESYDKKNQLVTINIGPVKSSLELESSTANGGGEYILIIDDNIFFTINEKDVENKIIVTDNINMNLITKITALGAKGIIYTEGVIPAGAVTAWKLKNKKDLNKIAQQKSKYVIISDFEKKTFFYS